MTPIATEVNTLNDPAVRNNPTLVELLVTNFPVNTQGFTFRFQVKVFTVGDRSSLSEISFITKASVPAKPIDVPVNDVAITNDANIKVTYGNPPPYDGGSPILSYEIQMDDGLAGPFTSIMGFDTKTMLTYTVS